MRKANKKTKARIKKNRLKRELLALKKKERKIESQLRTANLRSYLAHH